MIKQITKQINTTVADCKVNQSHHGLTDSNVTDLHFLSQGFLRWIKQYQTIIEHDSLIKETDITYVPIDPPMIVTVWSCKRRKLTVVYALGINKIMYQLDKYSQFGSYDPQKFQRPETDRSAFQEFWTWLINEELN